MHHLAMSTRKIIRNLDLKDKKKNNINKFIYTKGHRVLSESIKITMSLVK